MPRRLILSFITLLAFASCDTDSRKFDVREITHKLPEEVEAIMGKPDTSYFHTVVTKRFFAQEYHQVNGKFDLEIQYIDGRSDDIIVTNLSDDHPFNPEVLSLFGLPVATPTETFENGYFKWKDFEGYHIINAYSTHLDDSGRVDEYKVFFKSAQ
jgi:hypothetical protein